MKFRALFLAALGAACLSACSDAPEQPSTELGLEDQAAGYQAAAVDNLCDGYVATKVGAECHDLGDSLLFSGLALATLTCEQGAAILDAIEASQAKRKGYFVRYEPLAASFKGNENSRDGVTGAILGLTVYAEACPSARPRVASMWRTYRDALGSNPVALYPGNVHALVTPGFAAVLQQADHDLADGPAVPLARVVIWGKQSIDTTRGIVKRHDACYPIHLITLQAWLLGRGVYQEFYNAFCDETRGAGLALTDWYCGSDAATVESWLKSYQPNAVAVYQHQRCSWESETLDPGTDSPALDWLMLYTLSKRGTRT